LGNRLVIEVSADSFSNLCAKVKPTFTWRGRDMIWVEHDADGIPLFLLNCAYLHETAHGKIQWVLIKPQQGDFDEWYAQVMGDNLKGVARLRDDRPASDHGSGDYAVVLAESDQYGTVYEIGWQKLMANGTSLAQVERRLYLLKDRDNKWTFLGEGPGNSRGKIGGRGGYSTTSTPSVMWMENPGVPCRIAFAIENRNYEWASDDDPPGELRRDLVLLEEMALDGSSRQPRRITTRPLIRVEQGDTLEALVEHLSSWTLGWERGDDEKRGRIRGVCREALIRLNPGIDFESLIPGAKVAVLTYAETVGL
jgi:hypothetical protein